ncbi:MAG: hypothetical protein HAW65_07180, partial [Alphaproteobacteria bacterium]|nr:hypothetical protein [Alphaproteobacteria bacterium]
MRGIILSGLIIFGIYLIYDGGLLGLLVRGDSSYISYVIIGIWAVASVRWLYLLRWIERKPPLSSDMQEAETILAQKLGHGYLAADVVLKLGLMGTIIGFILMLRPISEINGFDATNL